MSEPRGPSFKIETVAMVLMTVGSLAFGASAKFSAGEQAAKDISLLRADAAKDNAALRADMKEALKTISDQIAGIPDERAKVRALESRSLESREDLGKHDARLRLLEDAGVRMRTDLDNLKAASSVPLRR